MNFLNRLKYYLIGVGLGILLVLAIFKDRNLTAWTPQNQVLKHLDNVMIITEIASCQMYCLKIDPAEVQSVISNGKVNFSDSDVRGLKKRSIKSNLNTNYFVQQRFSFKIHLPL